MSDKTKKVENKNSEVKETSKKVEKCDCNCKKKKVIIGVIALVVVAVIAVLLIVFLGKDKTNEKELTANMEKLGGQFYEKFYYPAQEKSQKDVKDFVKKMENTGIKVNLENIAKVSSVDKALVEGMVNSKTKKECDKVNTFVKIIPKAPYTAKDYTVEVTLACGFEDKEEKNETKKEVKETTKKETKTETKKTEAKKDETKKTETKKTTKK